MTDKKAKILEVALEMFARFGFNGISTSKIARAAEVSEGLIFRHFESKRGLLDAILEEGRERLNRVYLPILVEENPVKVIQKSILIPYNVPVEEYDFWRLMFKLKWEINYPRQENIKPILDKLTLAFSELKYQEPEKEATILYHIIEGISIGILKDGIETALVVKDFVLDKYKIFVAQ